MKQLERRDIDSSTTVAAGKPASRGGTALPAAPVPPAVTNLETKSKDMKKIKKFTAGRWPLAAVFLTTANCLLTTVSAQISVTTTNASGGLTTITGPQSYFTSVSQYFTSFNTNQPIHGKVQLWTGATCQNGVSIANDFGARYKVWSPSTNTAVAVESVTRNAGIAGVVVSEQAGAAFCYDMIDTEVSAGLLGGYRLDKSQMCGTVYADVRKNTSQNMFAGLRLAYELDAGDKAAQPPLVSIFAGIEF